MRGERVQGGSQAAVQRHAQSVVERLRDRWRQSLPVAQLLAALDAYADGKRCEDCAPLAACLSSSDAATDLIAPLIGALCAGLRRHPLAHVPLRHQFSRGVAVLELARSGRASLSLVAYDGAALAGAEAASSIAFADEERRELCLAGAAQCRVVRLVGERHCGAQLAVEPVHLAPDVALALGPDAARTIDRIAGRVVLLRLVRHAEQPGPVREFALADGRLLHQASGDRRESREEMTLALLGRMGRRDAAAPMAKLALGHGSAHLRWQALRNALALDSEVGFAALERLAVAADDALAVPACDLRSRLLVQHPELAVQPERVPCPA